MSRYTLTPLKLVYKKLRLLVDRGCVFIGHGLSKDFRIISKRVHKISLSPVTFSPSAVQTSLSHRSRSLTPWTCTSSRDGSAGCRSAFFRGSCFARTSRRTRTTRSRTPGAHLDSTMPITNSSRKGFSTRSSKSCTNRENNSYVPCLCALLTSQKK